MSTNEAHIVCVVHRINREKTKSYVYYTKNIISNGQDVLMFLVDCLGWFSQEKVSNPVGDPINKLTIRYAIDYGRDELLVYVHKPEKNKIFLFLRGTMGELCESGVIMVGGNSFKSLTSFAQFVISRGNTITSKIPYYYNGVCGCVGEFKGRPLEEGGRLRFRISQTLRKKK